MIMSLQTIRVVILKGSAGARAFEVDGPNLKVGRPKFFIDFSTEKACRA